MEDSFEVFSFAALGFQGKPYEVGLMRGCTWFLGKYSRKYERSTVWGRAEAMQRKIVSSVKTDVGST